MYSTPVGRAIVWLKRLAIAAERIADHFSPPPRPRRPAQFSVASTESFEEGRKRQDQDAARGEEERIRHTTEARPS